MLSSGAFVFFWRLAATSKDIGVGQRCSLLHPSLGYWACWPGGKVQDVFLFPQEAGMQPEIFGDKKLPGIF